MKLSVIQNRSCGSCSVCCDVMGVHELGKPSYQRCARLEDYGCRKYKKRPSSCRNYSCLWLQGIGVTRPDDLGVLISPAHFHLIQCYETRKLGWQTGKEEVLRVAKQLIRRFPQYDGITIHLFGTKIGITYPVQPPYEDRGEQGLIVRVRLAEVVDGVRVFMPEGESTSAQPLAQDAAQLGLKNL